MDSDDLLRSMRSAIEEGAHGILVAVEAPPTPAREHRLQELSARVASDFAELKRMKRAERVAEMLRDPSVHVRRWVAAHLLASGSPAAQEELERQALLPGLDGTLAHEVLSTFRRGALASPLECPTGEFWPLGRTADRKFACPGKQVSSPDDVRALLAAHAALTYFWVDWSASERASRKDFAKAVETLNVQRRDIAIFCVCADEAATLELPWLRGEITKSWLGYGSGAIVWSRKGRIAERAASAAHLGAAEIVRRTHDIFADDGA